ncbi:glycoside hydrolase family 43 protein [Pelagicoccus albus]|uniref:glycoside hydrolase family 43 protein n=1 Tax=Pelagicoccus albus TaxID=415222 RepID=UPI0030DC44BF
MNIGEIHAASDSVHFDWFEYEGKDVAFSDPVPEGSFQNPILAGFYPDPSMCRVEDDFYMVTSTFAFWPGVPIFHSQDLVNWEQIGHVLDRPSQLDNIGDKVSESIFAPTIRHHDGVFYMITTAVQGINNFYVTATGPAGPWSDPILLPWVDGIDPSFFFDDDGRVYITHNGLPPQRESLYEGHRAVWLWEIDMESGEPIGEGKIIVNGGVDLSEEPVWIEAPHIFKRGDWYYLTCAEGGTSQNHSQVIFRAKSLGDEWIAWEENPILTQRDLSPDRPNPIDAAGHADFVQLENGDWWASFLAVRPYEGGFYGTGRETFLLPVEWTEDDWPIILPAGQEVPWTLPKPDLAPSEVSMPTTGNFSIREEFDGDELGMEWITLRTPVHDWSSLEEKAGFLSIDPLAVELSELDNPSWLCRRIQHATYSASSSLLAPAPGVEAGVALLIREDHYFFVGIQYVNDEYVVFLEKADGGEGQIVVQVPLPELKEGEALVFKIEADRSEISFKVQTEGSGELDLAENEDATILTTQKAWGFVGTMIGPYARLEATE